MKTIQYCKLHIVLHIINVNCRGYNWYKYVHVCYKIKYKLGYCNLHLFQIQHIYTMKKRFTITHLLCEHKSNSFSLKWKHASTSCYKLNVISYDSIKLYASWCFSVCRLFCLFDVFESAEWYECLSLFPNYIFFSPLSTVSMFVYFLCSLAH